MSCNSHRHIITVMEQQYPQDILHDGGPSGSQSKTTDGSNKYRHPQYKRQNESAAQHGRARALTARVDGYVASITGSVIDDSGWSLIPNPSSSSARSSSSGLTDGGTGDAALTAAPVQELTTDNVQLHNMMNDTSSMSERLWRRLTLDENDTAAGPGGHPRSTLRLHHGSLGDNLELAEQREPWGTAATVSSYHLDTFGVGDWAGNE